MSNLAENVNNINSPEGEFFDRIDAMTYQEAVAFIEALPKISKGDYMSPETQDRSVYLKRMRFLLDQIGNPEASIPNFLHVGGTSGKGSVTRMLAESLHANGEQVGAYTSPFITTTVERFWMNGKLMSAKRYAELVQWIKPHLLECLQSCSYGMPSYFEIQLAIALQYFKEERCEWVVLEVGCGGEFDATNIIPPPRAAIITNVGLDHMHMLGDTKAKIAATKAKIIKTRSHAFTSESSPRIRRIIQNEADKQHTPLTYVSGGNAELVRAVLRHIDPSASLRMTKLPGRFEMLQKKPLVVLDVAHNPDKIQYLVDNWQSHKFKKPHVLFAAAANKDHKNMLKPLLEIARSITFTPFASSSRECANPVELERIAKKLKPNLKTNVFLSSDEGLDHLLSKNKNEPILITGSFFLAADLRRHWISPSLILKKRNSFGK